MKRKRTRKEPYAFRIASSDRSRLETVADNLGLSRSEIMRRSIRMGLPLLAAASLPGSEETAPGGNDVQV